MIKNLLEGLWRGALFGLFYALADTMFVYKAADIVMELRWDPFTMTTVRLMSWCFLVGLIHGGWLGVVGGRRLLDKPSRHVHAVAGATIATVIFGSPEFDSILLMGLGGVGIAHGNMLIVTALMKKWKPAPAAVLAGFAVFWTVVMRIGIVPEPSTKADPNRVRPAADAPNVLWVVFDTTRADHLPLYGYKRNTTPNLVKLAAEGAVFDRAYSTAPWTVASHASMFTGTYPSQHWCNHEHLFLNPDRVTGAELLRDSGYDTAVFAGNPWLGDQTGLTQGHEVLVPAGRDYSLYSLFVVGRIRQMLMVEGEDKGGKEIVESFERWLKGGRDPNRPFFAFVNFLEPHSPYHQVPHVDAKRFLPEDVTWEEAADVSRLNMSKMMFATDYVANERQDMITQALYDGGIYNADRRFGELIDSLRAAGKLDNTLVIVNADHGELFGEHGLYGHDLALYNPLLHVPLIMRFPKQIPAGIRVDKPVQLTDIHTTILEVTGNSDKILPNVRGQSIMPLLNGGGDPERPLFAEYYRTKMRPLVKEIRAMGFDPETYRLKSVQVGDLRMIRWPGPLEKVFDISTDPGELTDISKDRPDAHAMLKGKLDEFVIQNPPAGDGGTGVPEMDAATKEKLRSLGYIQ